MPRYLKLSPELGDGYVSSIVPADEERTVLDAVRVWLREAMPPGESCTIEVVEMTGAEFDALIDL